MGHDDFIAQATAWARGGRRSVTVEIGGPISQEPEVSAWFYDYDLMAGVRIGLEDPLPDPAAMEDTKARSLSREIEQLKRGRLQELERQLDTLNRNTEALHGQTVRGH